MTKIKLVLKKAKNLNVLNAKLEMSSYNDNIILLQ